MTRIKLALLLVILLLGFCLRLYKFDSPVADWHSWRQADTSSVSREFVNNGFDLLRPKYHDLGPLPGVGLPNPEGYRFVEFPIYNLLQAGGYKFIGIISLEQWGRIISALASVLSASFIFLLLRKYVGDTAGLFGAFFYSVIPFSVYYGRVILPDPLMTSAILGGIYFFDRWLDNKSKLIFAVAAIFTSLSFLLKPFALFFTLPMIFLAYNKFGKEIFKVKSLWLFGFLTLTPLSLWRIWELNYPEGIPDADWLFNEGGIRFTGAFFYWIFAERIGKLILGYWGIALFILGFLRKPDKMLFFFLSFLLSSLLYVAVIAKGNVNHDYYQIAIIPTIVFFMALGVDFLLKHSVSLFPKYTAYTVITVCTVFSLMFGWYFVRDFYNINNPLIVEVGREVDSLLPDDAVVVAPYGGDTAFLYQTNRRGFSDLLGSPEEMIEKGATHMVIVNPSQNDSQLKDEYKVIVDKQNYLILELKNLE